MKRFIVRAVTFLFVAVCARALLVAQGNVRYVYDELDRLIAVTDVNGDTATYAYDAVGNILAINRYASTTVSIVTFSPKQGPVGTVVTIAGTGFSSTPSQNTVKINGVTATVSSASATTLVVTVPVTATTGSISVTAPAGSAVSATTFTVAASAIPTITSISPIVGAAGTALTVTGTNFNTTPFLNSVLFNGNPGSLVSSATVTTLGLTTAATATSGRLTVLTPLGSTTSSPDFFVPPSPYVATDVASTGRTALGTAKAVGVGTANKIGLVVVDGAAGQRVSVKAVPGPNSTVSVYRPDGSLLMSRGTGITTVLLEPPALAATGTYLISVDPVGTATGTVTITPYDVPADLSGTITPSLSGSSANAVISVPGQNARYTVASPTHARVSLLATPPAGTVLVLNPDGSTLKSVAVGALNTFVEPWTFAVGQSVKADLLEANTGTVTLTAYDVPNDVTGALTVNGTTVPVTVTGRGQNGTLTFSGTAAQTVTVRVTGNTMGSVTVRLLSANGTTVLATTTSILSSFNLAAVALPSAGTYSVVVDPATTNTGTLNLRVTSP